jgi:hypothetical protein
MASTIQMARVSPHSSQDANPGIPVLLAAKERGKPAMERSYFGNLAHYPKKQVQLALYSQRFSVMEAQTLGTGTRSGGKATYTTSTLPAGTNSITAASQFE